MSTNIRDVARRERAAEQTREEADAAWRAAWWATTLALAAIEGQRETARAFAEVADELGYKTHKYLSHRKATGRRVEVDHLLKAVIHSLPPRLSVVFASEAGHRIDAQAAEVLLQAERDGVSLREFAKQLDAMPVSWENAEDRAARERAEQDTRDAEHAAELERVREEARRGALAEATPDELGEEYANRPTADKTQFHRASAGASANRLRSEGITPPADRKRDQDGAFITARHELSKAVVAVHSAFDQLVENDLDTEQRGALTGDLDRLNRWTDLIRERLRGGSIDEELAALLRAGN